MPKGYPKNPELTRQRLRDAAKVRVMPDIWYKKLRERLIKRNKSKSHIKKVKKANTGVKFTEERKLNLKLNHADTNGDKNPRWKGGSYVHNYKFIYYPSHPLRNLKGYVREHLLVLYKHLGERINKSNIIHHIDGNKINNNIENLMVMKNHGAHRRIHCNKTIDGDIIFDGREIR